METNDINPRRSLDWLKKAIEALVEHRSDDRNHLTFIRSSKSCIPTAKRDAATVEPACVGAPDETAKRAFRFFRTATFHAYCALADAFRLLDELGEGDFLKGIGQALGLEKREANKADEKHRIHDLLCEKLKELLEASAEGDFSDGSANKGPRSIILWEAFANAVGRTGLSELSDQIEKIVASQKMPTNCFPDPPGSPWFILSTLTCSETLKGFLNTDKLNGNIVLRDEYVKTVDRHLDYQMARASIGGHAFDPVSLAIATCCKLRLDEGFRSTPLYVDCLRKIFACQQPDGCWPSGAAISLDETADVIQQPSIELATELIESIVDYGLLVEHTEQSQQVIALITPCFRRLAHFIETTYCAARKGTDNGDKTIHGWCSDRAPLPGYTETWITAYVCRFLLKYHLLEKAYLRAKALQKLEVPFYTPKHRPDKWKESEKWEEIMEPDSILEPKKRIETLIGPLEDKMTNGLPLKLCKKDRVSFILCGPPGSGKTYLVNQLAHHLDWPLVELSPSHFIRNGIEFIESTSKEVFDTLMQLFHAVVFFDECDELFRERKSDEEKSGRNILNFLTPCMLPKLQKLHDQRHVLFVVGTNFLCNMDKAITRSGRFDIKLILDRPDEACREKFLPKNDDGQIAPDNFLKQTCGMTITELKQNKSKDNSGYVFPEDYKEWLRSTASRELRECTAPHEAREKKQAYWDKLCPGDDEVAWKTDRHPTEADKIEHPAP